MINTDYFGKLPDSLVSEVIKWSQQPNIRFLSKRFCRLHKEFTFTAAIEKILRLPQAQAAEVRKPLINERSENQYKSLRGWLQKEYGQVVQKLYTRLPEENFEVFFENFLGLLDAGAEPKCLALFLEDSRVPDDFAKQATVLSRLRRIIDVLLMKGANPNHQGRISTPLLTLLYGTPRSPSHISWMANVARVLCEKGADPELIPKKDSGGYHLSPRDYAAKHFKALLPELKK